MQTQTETIENNSGTTNIKHKTTCKNGWSCHGRKSGKCCFVHIHEQATTSSDPNSGSICRNGWSCHGRKSGKCGFVHIHEQATTSSDPIPTTTDLDVGSIDLNEGTTDHDSIKPSAKICRNGWTCHGRKSGKCSFVHIRDTSSSNPDPGTSNLKICKWGVTCHGRSGKCPFSHPEESSICNGDEL